jgi:hypothetical protein
MRHLYVFVHEQVHDSIEPKRIVSGLLHKFPDDHALFGEGNMADRDISKLIASMKRKWTRVKETPLALESRADFAVRQPGCCFGFFGSIDVVLAFPCVFPECAY